MFLTNNDQKATWNFCTLKAANATFSPTEFSVGLFVKGV